MNWISVKERLPEVDKDVLFWGIYGHTVGYVDHCDDLGYTFWSAFDLSRLEDSEAKFWMPLPEPPKEDK